VKEKETERSFRNLINLAWPPTGGLLAVGQNPLLVPSAKSLPRYRFPCASTLQASSIRFRAKQSSVHHEPSLAHHEPSLAHHEPSLEPAT